MILTISTERSDSVNQVNTNELLETLHTWVKDNIQVIQEVKTPLLPTTYINEDSFILKKVAGGKLEMHHEIEQLMFACEFNQVRTISSIDKIVCKDNTNYFIISCHNGHNSITFHIINSSKGGVFCG